MSTFRFNTTFTPAKGLPVTWVDGVRKARNASGALVDFASLDATARDAAKVAISADADLVQRHVSAAMTTLDPAPPAGIYEMEAWEDGQSMDEEPCALSVNQVYWTGTGEMSPSPTVVVLPAELVVPDTGEVKPKLLCSYQFAKIRIQFSVIDQAGEPIDLTGKSLALTVFIAGAANKFVLTTSGGHVTVGGTSGNDVSIEADDTFTQDAGEFRWNFRNLTDDVLLGRGPFIIGAENDAA